MKHIKILYKVTILVFVAGLMFTSCDNEDDSNGSSELIVESISFAENDSLVNTGYANNMYIIRGEGFSDLRKIYFNETDTYFNPTLVTDQVIFVTIADGTPFRGENNNLVLQTSDNSVTYEFPIGAPPPSITGFNPLAGGAGDIVTIEGEVFDDLIEVRFGDIPAEVVSSTTTEIKVRVPEGVVQAPIFVETEGGITRATQTFGFKYLIYDDSLDNSWWIGGWDGTQDFENTEQVRRGDFAIKRTYTGAYSGFQIGNGTGELSVSDYQAIKMSIYTTSGGQNVQLVINSNYDAPYVISLTQGEWTNITVPFEELGSPSGTINEIVVQEISGNAPVVIYIDDIGLI
ncbi:hypothetical protein SAMN04487907_101879 [Zunongwangia mangrovi]|uniref:IPT/TIG domain-containing protein n=1 Tax=Zunongwangia mangrovi TaxID=1334022 RepID=A0A1I1EC46_9FLAO|nr:IPT/TIG domain-containing protein [Zunongwangia mangrovi]SFB84316.1 hypothetical protein SAMN04487907_101879 [Zunongwangia mangrovi]